MYIPICVFVCVFYLQQSDSNRQCNTGGAEGPFTLRNGPGVSLKLTEQVSQIHIHSVHRLKEPRHIREVKHPLTWRHGYS